jgi:hypothetical protein
MRDQGQYRIPFGDKLHRLTRTSTRLLGLSYKQIFSSCYFKLGNNLQTARCPCIAPIRHFLGTRVFGDCLVAPPARGNLKNIIGIAAQRLVDPFGSCRNWEGSSGAF